MSYSILAWLVVIPPILMCACVCGCSTYYCTKNTYSYYKKKQEEKQNEIYSTTYTTL